MITDFDFDAVIRLGKAKYSDKAFSSAVFALQNMGVITNYEGELKAGENSFLYLDSKKVYDILSKHIGRDVDFLANKFSKEIEQVDNEVHLFLRQGKEASDLESRFSSVLSEFFITSFFYAPSNNTNLYSVDDLLLDKLLCCIRTGIACCLITKLLDNEVLIDMVVKYYH